MKILRLYLPCACALLAGPRPAAASEGVAPVRVAHHLQVGAALFTEGLLSAPEICPMASAASCIFGSGAGVEVGVGYRMNERWYFGGAYGFSRQDASNLIRLPILQQFRAKVRFYWLEGTAMSPYLNLATGVALYGNEWTADTWGFANAVGLGLTYQVGEETVMGLGIDYRPIFFQNWVDQSGQERGGDLGLSAAHFLAVELTIELKSEISPW